MKNNEIFDTITCSLDFILENNEIKPPKDFNAAISF